MEVLTEGMSPIVDSWPLMGSPGQLVLLFLSYLVLVVKVGPRYMEKRKPMDLTNFTRLYNIMQVLICSFFIYWTTAEGFSIVLWRCDSEQLQGDRLILYKTQQWWFLWLRLAELVETVVFVLRKKQNQISTLHVYHHISTATIVWLFIKYCKSEIKKR